MPKLNQRGAVQFIVLLILLAGIVAGVYLVQQTQIYKPKADISKPIGPETSFTLVQSGNPARKCPQIFRGFKWFGFCDVEEENSNVITVSLYARSDIEEANLFAAKLNFPNDLLEVVTIQTNAKGGKACPPPPECKGGNLIYGDPSPDNPDQCPQYDCTMPGEEVCVQVITRACSNTDPQVCKDFPTPCDVPEGWVKEGPERVMPTKICETDEDCFDGYVCSSPPRSDFVESIPPNRICVPKSSSEPQPSPESKGFIEKWLDTSFDNSNGTISLVGGVSDPGYQTQVSQPPALMAIILFRIKEGGQGKISFNDSSAIYSNKNNINILTIKRDLEVDTSRPKPQPSPPSGACRSDSDCKDGQRCDVECGPVPLCPINVEDPDDACNKALEQFRESCIGKCVSVPSPSCEPKPACLDASPRCLLPEPPEGWCPTEEIICGTIAGLGCPKGYECKLDGDYPDASGKCVRIKPVPSVKPTPKPLPVPGDLNNDKKTNLIDASIFFSRCTNPKIFNKQIIGQDTCDLNSDGKINSFDLGFLIKLLIENKSI